MVTSAVAIVNDARPLGLRPSGHKAAGILTDFTEEHKKSWDQFDEYDSQGLHCVMQTSEKAKVRRSEKFKSKFFISAVRTLEEMKDRSDVPAETRGDLPRIS